MINFKKTQNFITIPNKIIQEHTLNYLNQKNHKNIITHLRYKIYIHIYQEIIKYHLHNLIKSSKKITVKPPNQFRTKKLNIAT